MTQQPPPILNYVAPQAASPKLRAIAMNQRAICICILAYIGLVIAQFLVPPEIGMIVAVGAIGVSITAAVFVFKLALLLYPTGTGVVMGILTLIPLVGLIVLLIVNGKATTTLKNYGVHVGLLGADMKTLPVGC